MHKDHLHPDSLERYAFLWSEARLLIAAIALFIGGIPPVLLILPSIPLVGAALTLSWVMSGVASAYLLYRWFPHKTLFGKQEITDKVAFFVSIVSGFNLGITGLVGTNIGMSLSFNYIVFVLAAFVYLASAGYLFKRWKESGQKLFAHTH